MSDTKQEQWAQKLTRGTKHKNAFAFRPIRPQRLDLGNVRQIGTKELRRLLALQIWNVSGSSFNIGSFLHGNIGFVEFVCLTCGFAGQQLDCHVLLSNANYAATLLIVLVFVFLTTGDHFSANLEFFRGSVWHLRILLRPCGVFLLLSFFLFVRFGLLLSFFLFVRFGLLLTNLESLNGRNIFFFSK